METNISNPINTQYGSIKLGKFISQQHRNCYFDLYDTNKNNIICLVTNNKFQGEKNIQMIINRIDECAKCLSDDEGGYGFKKYGQKIKISIENKTKLIMFYQGIQPNKCIKNMKKKLQTNNIIDLAMFLVDLLLKIKQNNVSFGGFHPNRIFRLDEYNFCIIGGEFFSEKLTSKQFLVRNEKLKNDFNSDWKYQPPQLYIEDNILHYSSDLFVVGCILHEMITGEYPYPSKQSLISKSIPPQQNYSQITKYICEKILQPANPSSRVEPQQLLHMLEMQRGKTMFNTCKYNLPIPNQIASTKTSFFDNFQQFIMKCTTETQGWFLHFCQNSSQNPQSKYLEQILFKIVKKKEKISKLISLIEKCSQKTFAQQNMTKLPQQDNTYSLLKMGILLLNVVRKIPLEFIQPYINVFTKVCSQIITKNPSNLFMAILYKTIAFKMSLQAKFLPLYGNFHLKIEQYMQLGIESLDYMSQYCLKILTYLASLAEHGRIDHAKPSQTSALLCLCDELYNSVSILLYCLMAMKKDNSLKIADRETISDVSFKKIDGVCKQIVIKISKLCETSSVFSCHSIYSINSDYYEYQEDICLMYQPVLTSFEYFHYDKNQYKGLTMPEDYSKVYEKQQNNYFEQFQNEAKFANRKPMLNRMGSMKNPQISNQTKNKVTINKQEFGSDNQEKSNKQQALSQNKEQFEGKAYSSAFKQQPKKQNQSSFLNDFQAFMSNVKTTKPQTQVNLSNDSKLTNTTGASKNDESLPSVDESWLEAETGDLMSYEWLKKTQKTIGKQFQKPELDPIIYVVYEDFCKSLKLQQLISLLGKNKKVIVDPNQVLFQKIIGSGNAGDVYIGKYQQKIVAIKKVKIASNPNALKQFQREVLTYIKIKTHPNLVSLVGLTKYNQDYFLLTQFCEGGSLFDLLHKKVNQIALSWKERLSIVLDIAKGMEFLHYMNPPVIHRDLKSLNVFMIKRNGNWVAKVADFGLSRSHQAGMMTSALGTLHWMAPQLLSNKQYSLKVDVYSFGVLLWQICTRRTPYHNLPNQMAIVKYVVLEKGRPMLELINQGCPQTIIDLIQKCWSQEPEDRPYFPQIVAEISKIQL